VGGSLGLTGAPSMSSESAQRTGAGYVTACVPRSVNYVFELRLLEAMSVPLPEDDGALGPEAVDAVLEHAQRADAIVLGPGLGRADGTFAFARSVAAQVELPLLLDADGLNAHAGAPETIAQRPGPTVLTPHAGELGRLLDLPSAQIDAERLRHVRHAADVSGAIVVLKGDDSLIAEPAGRVAVSPGGAPALAPAGTGDVLSGTIGALLAKGMAAFDAACAGVALHAEAGRRAAGVHGPDTVIASDVIAALAAARER
jgi:NAD(P)H-hydrate epimerase